MSNILFDLDGTLVDSKAGIIESIQYALTQLNQTVPDASELEWCIGPPLKHYLGKLLNSDETELIDKAVLLYRKQYSEHGLYNCKLYEGIEETLKQLVAQGHKIFVATSKLKPFATRVLFHLAVDHAFSNIYGGEHQGDFHDKRLLIQHALETENLSPSETIMIGDKEHDILGAKLNEIRSIGASYGYGIGNELNKAGPDHLISSPQELLDLL